VSDANQIDINELRSLTFKNKIVTEFLDSTSKYFVIGSKGLGKTLMLTYKRSLLNEQYQGNDPRKHAAVKFIPEGRPYLDLMGDLPTIGKAVQMMSTLAAATCGACVSCGRAHARRPRARRRCDELAFPQPIRSVLEGTSPSPRRTCSDRAAIGELKQLLDRTEATSSTAFAAARRNVHLRRQARPGGGSGVRLGSRAGRNAMS
jgi:hypothetical protein